MTTHGHMNWHSHTLAQPHLFLAFKRYCLGFCVVVPSRNESCRVLLWMRRCQKKYHVFILIGVESFFLSHSHVFDLVLAVDVVLFFRFGIWMLKNYGPHIFVRVSAVKLTRKHRRIMTDDETKEKCARDRDRKWVRNVARILKVKILD